MALIRRHLPAGIYPTTAWLLPSPQFPTVADLVCLNVTKGMIPIQAGLTTGGFDWAATGKFPKLKRVADAVEAYPPVAAYLATSKTLEGDPFA